MITVPFFISHRGCPHRCVFCDQQGITGFAGEIPDAAAISEAVKRYRRGEPVEVAFFGGSFTALPIEVQEGLLQGVAPLCREGLVGSVRVSTRPDAITAEGASLLRSFGVKTVELGVQSMRDEVLARSGRTYAAADIAEAVRILRDCGMKVGLQLMIGLPGDDPVGALDSMRRVLALKPDFVRIYPTLVLRGTLLEGMLQRGEYVPLTLEEAVQTAKPMLQEAMRHGVPVIRIGLQAGESLEGAIVAGPYHPAFRELVEGELFFDLLLRIVPPGVSVRVSCHPWKVSMVVGQRRKNLCRLAEKGIKVDSVTGDASLEPHEVAVSNFIGPIGRIGPVGLI